ncbi:MAG TPA: hypothetical protein VLZ06_10180 [Solirubrobacteraceae bacterium]|nr:hypothetical protein [Solirubrobacteraceae bacterium]
MRRICTIALLGLGGALAIPAAAPATLAEIGTVGAAKTPAVPSCPASPCLAVSRTTGFQVKVGTTKNPMNIPREGSIVAWSITLAKPTSAQIKYFNSSEGGPAEAGIAVLAPQKKPNLTYKLVAQGPTVKLQSYFGQTAQFPLPTSIPVKKGELVALTVPTWAPALALNFGNDTSWRASRTKAQCNSTSTQTSHTQIGSPVQYYCLYQTARLTYGATLISTP